jgi:hypothetical protein
MKRLLLVYILFLLLSCSKDKVDSTVGPLTVEFDNSFDENLNLSIDYDITGIQLKRDDNAIYDDKNTIHHVSEDNESSQEISLKDLPVGTYTQVTFTIKSLDVEGGFVFHKDEVTVVLPMTGTGAPVRAEHEPEIHLIFDMSKLQQTSDVSASIVVDHIHAN